MSIINEVGKLNTFYVVVEYALYWKLVSICYFRATLKLTLLRTKYLIENILNGYNYFEVYIKKSGSICLKMFLIKI